MSVNTVMSRKHGGGRGLGQNGCSVGLERRIHGAETQESIPENKSERECVCLDADTETDILSGQEGSRSLLCHLHICSRLSGGVRCVGQQSQLLCLTPRIQPLLPGVLHGMVQSRLLWTTVSSDVGFPGGSDGKASVCNAGDPGSVPRLGRSPGEGNGYPLQYSCLESSMDRGAWSAIVHWIEKSQTRLSD